MAGGLLRLVGARLSGLNTGRGPSSRRKDRFWLALRAPLEACLPLLKLRLNNWQTASMNARPKPQAVSIDKNVA